MRLLNNINKNVNLEPLTSVIFCTLFNYVYPKALLSHCRVSHQIFVAKNDTFFIAIIQKGLVLTPKLSVRRDFCASDCQYPESFTHSLFLMQETNLLKNVSMLIIVERFLFQSIYKLDTGLQTKCLFYRKLTFGPRLV